MWRASQWPMRGGQFIRRKLGSGLDESVSVEGDTAVEPLSAGSGTRHDEHVTNVLSLRRPVVTPAQLHALEVIITIERGDFGMRVEGDPRILFDASDQV